MCGIFGEYFPGQLHTPEPVFRALNDLNKRRGPDSDGIWRHDKGVQMGFRRLAILDVSSAGNQPMLSANGQWTVTFNGEIYNFKELRERILQKGYVLKGHSDTEVMVNHVEAFGVEDTIRRLDGMFAIALFHHESGVLHLVRDFAGIKPLWLAQTEHGIVYGSQYDQLWKHPALQGATMDQEVLALYLEQHFIPAPYGILKGTSQLEPGEHLIFTPGKPLVRQRYWDFPVEVEKEETDLKRALENLEHHLDEAVLLELESDVPLGTFLSGGIDSPLVAWFAAQHVSTKLKAFSIGSDSKNHDESADAEAFAQAMNLDFQLERIKASDAASMLDEVMACFPEPFADPSAIPTWLVSGMARKQVTVALSGDGGDELFYGYERFHSLNKNAGWLNKPLWIRKRAYQLSRLGLPLGINDNVVFPRLGDAHRNLHNRFKRSDVSRIFPDLPTTRLPLRAYDYDFTPDESKRFRLMARGEFYGMMQKTLTKVDRTSMGHSLEVRVPFLLKRMIEASMQVHHALSTDKGGRKDVLKKLLADKIPSVKQDQRKRGFSVPLSGWIRQDLKDPFYEAITEEGFLQAMGMNGNMVKQLFREHLTTDRDRKWPLFTLYSLAKFWENLQRR